MSEHPYSPCATLSNTTVVKLVMFYASMIYGIHRHVHILSHETALSNIGLFLGNLRNQIGTKEDYITSHGSMSSEWATSSTSIGESIGVKMSIIFE